jgi:RNA polymerase sigma-70 factor (ECF subfamily)
MLERDAMQLIAAAQRGDSEATRRLVLAWQPRVRNLVRYLVRGDDQVDDLSQQALLTALEKLPAYRGEGRIEAWLDGIVLRVTLRAMRRFRLVRFREVEHVDDTYRGQSSDDPQYRDRRKLVAALDQLPEKQRNVLIMHHVIGMSLPEIAAFEQIPEETARSRLRNGMAQLRASFRLASEET